MIAVLAAGAPGTKPAVSPAGWRQRVRHGLLMALIAAVAASSILMSVTALNSRVERQMQQTGHHFVLSDLYPRWMGARELLRGGDPYAPAFSAQLQEGFYGRQFSAEEEIARYQSVVGFFYPPYVVIPLLPLLWLPFEVVRWLSAGLLAAALMWSTLAWYRMAHRTTSPVGRLAIAAVLLTSYPAMDLLWLQQLTGLVLAYLVGAYACVRRGWLACAGVLLALAMIKPQVALLPAAGLLFWALWRRERWPAISAFGLTMAGQLALSEWLLPGWIARFLAETGRYQHLNSSVYWVPEKVTGNAAAGAILIALPLLLAAAWAWWRARRDDASSGGFVRTAALTFAVAAALIPADSSHYNRVLLIVPLVTLALAGRGTKALRRAATTFAWVMVCVPTVLLAIAGVAVLTNGEDIAWAMTLLALATYLFAPLLVAPASLAAVVWPQDHARGGAPAPGAEPTGSYR